MKRQSTAVWKGALADGSGQLSTQSGALDKLPYTFKGRFKDESGKSGTNPEELIGAAHAGCFAMQLSHMLAENGTPADELNATAEVVFGEASGGGFEIRESNLKLVGKVPGIEEAKFKELAEKAKSGCPVSKALGALKVSLDARLG